MSATIVMSDVSQNINIKLSHQNVFDDKKQSIPIELHIEAIVLDANDDFDDVCVSFGFLRLYSSVNKQKGVMTDEFNTNSTY